MPGHIRSEILQRRWVHSHEEDSEAELVYRPAAYGFPPSRGRGGFELRPDGTMLRIGPGPTDRPQTAEGSWRLEGDRLILEPGATAEAARTLRIVSASKDRLVLRR